MQTHTGTSILQTEWDLPVWRTSKKTEFLTRAYSYVNKEINLARMRLYFNSFSEMLIPTSLWEQTRQEKLEIFSAMDATEIRDIMVR